MTHDQLITRLRSLKERCNEAIKEVARDECSRDAINWADLRCVEAMHVVNDSGQESYAVLIEEASPDAAHLQAAIRRRLGKLGWVGVEVRTEW